MLIAFILIVIHHIADFMFQTEEMATGKSKSFKILLKHTGTYTLVFFVAFALWCTYQNHIGHVKPEDIGWTPLVFLFFPITFICHTVIDYVSSKITARKFAKKEYYTGIPNFGVFAVINIDQMFHYATLFLTYYFLTENIVMLENVIIFVLSLPLGILLLNKLLSGRVDAAYEAWVVESEEKESQEYKLKKLNDKFETVIKDIERLNELDSKSIPEKVLKFNEEFGEFSQELIKLLGFTHKIFDEEHFVEESADSLQVILSIQLAACKLKGIDFNRVLDKVLEKDKKWEEKLKEYTRDNKSNDVC